MGTPGRVAEMGPADWIALKDLKDSYPVELATYAADHKIENEPAFAWWVPYTLRKQKRILQKVKSKYWAQTHSTASLSQRTSRKRWKSIRNWGITCGWMP
jgi:hypothetical protein